MDALLRLQWVASAIEQSIIVKQIQLMYITLFSFFHEAGGIAG